MINPAEVAFKLSVPVENDKNSQRVVKIESSPLFVFFATEKKTGLGFLIQGPYRTTPARDNIPYDDEWNKDLLKQTAELIVDALRRLKAMGLLDVSVLETMPIRETYFPSESMFRPIYDRVAQALKEEELIPALDSGFVCGYKAIIGRGEGIRNLLSSHQLSTLFGDKSDEDDSGETYKLQWLHERITEGRSSDLRTYLMKALVIQEVDPEKFAQQVDYDFLSQQSDQWLIELYKFLGLQEALWRKSKNRWYPNGSIRHKEIIRLDDNKQVSAFAKDGTVVVYLPHQGTKQLLSLPTIKSDLIKDPETIEFFKKLGLYEPDIAIEVLEHVLPLYKPETVDIFDMDHHAHISAIIQALQVDSNERRQKLREKLKQSRFLFGENVGTGEKCRVRPQKLYVRTSALSVFLEGNEHAYFLDKRYDEEQIKVFLELGLSDSPQIRAKERDYNGHVIVRHSHGWHKRGLDGFDPECEVKDLEFALQDPTIERSLFIWNNIAIPQKHHIKGTVETATRQNYENSSKETITSPMGELLQSNKWLPDIGGEFHRPSELSLTDLPEGFDQNESLALQLKMKNSELVTLAERTGVGVDTLNLAKKLNEMPRSFQNKIKEQMEEYENKPPFPRKLSHDPDNRQKRAKQGAQNAPKKTFEDRTRSVRASSTTDDTDTYLRESYINEKEQLVCQMCEQEMPFRRKDGKHYFESVQLFDDFSREHTGAYLALCPVCAAKYKEFVKRDEGNEKKVRAGISLSEIDEPITVEVTLGQEDGSIRFVQRHLLDVHGVLEAEGGTESERGL